MMSRPIYMRVFAGKALFFLSFFFFFINWGLVCGYPLFKWALTVVEYNTLYYLEVIKLLSCSTQLSMKFAMQIKFKLLTTANFFLAKHSGA